MFWSTTRKTTRRAKADTRRKSSAPHKAKAKKPKPKTKDLVAEADDPKKEFEKLACHPAAQSAQTGLTCYDAPTLLRLKEAWNKQNPQQIIRTGDPVSVWKELKHFFRDRCRRESCWVKEMDKWAQSNNRAERLDSAAIIKNSFAPESPKSWLEDPAEWLSNFDIQSVMAQFEKKYKCFEFIGSSPIDFDKKLGHGGENAECVFDELCRFDLAALVKKGKTKIGISFNTDPHTGKGEHWISMFINVPKRFIFFFDSAGDKAPRRVKKLVKRIMAQGEKMTPPIVFKYDENYPIDHQLRDSECGIYSLYFIHKMIEDKLTPGMLKNEKYVIRDKDMHEFRNIYFNERV